MLVGILCVLAGVAVYFSMKALYSHKTLHDTQIARIIESANNQSVEGKKDSILFKTAAREKTTEKKRITFTEKQLITTTSGEKIEAVEGDFLDGEFENGKVVRGKLYDKDKNVKKIILPKRNH
ncbi:hypothetical protein FACS189446_4740 [Bacteroidia bacterium]|nr:hypothetical protein FACS189446_4740 [Bacteroidia bacterium]